MSRLYMKSQLAPDDGSPPKSLGAFRPKRNMADLSLFSVKLSNFKCTNLDSKDSKTGLSDPYLEGNFDNFKNFKTEHIRKTLNPEWNYVTSFMYETKYPHKLGKKKFELRVTDWDRVGANDFIGSCTVDLHTLATGPVHHELTLKNEGAAAGKISFDCEMAHVTDVCATYSDLEATGVVFQKCTPNAYGVFSFVVDDSAVKTTTSFRTPAAGRTNDPVFPGSYEAFFHGSLRQLMDGSLRIKFMHEEAGVDDTIGRVHIDIDPFLDQEKRPFEGDIMMKGELAGRVKGFIQLSNLPKFANLKGGVHNDQGCVGGTLQHPTMERPEGWSE